MAKDTAPGRYTGRGTGTPMMGESSNGSGQIGASFALLDENGVAYDHVTFYGSLTGGAVDITLKQLRAAGWTGEDFDDWTGFGSVDVDVEVKYEMYQGEQKQKVGIWASGGGVAMKKVMDENKKRALNAQLKGAILKSKQGMAPAAGATAGGYAPRSAPPAGAYAPRTSATRPAQPEWDGTGREPGMDEDAFPG